MARRILVTVVALVSALAIIFFVGGLRDDNEMYDSLGRYYMEGID